MGFFPHFGISSPYESSLDILNTWHGKKKKCQVIGLGHIRTLAFLLVKLVFLFLAIRCFLISHTI